MKNRGLAMACDKAKFIWYHEVRNGQYHVGGATIPQVRDLEGLRNAALWVFTILFDISDVESLLEKHLSSPPSDDLPKRTDEDDRLIDREYGMVELAGKSYYVSEVLHAFDPVLYSELSSDIKRRDASNVEMNKETSV
ncbi:MAG: hypothetical protein MPW14_20470 [Candidatus Manganitrophus sp.]|nr:MAG: hypothetical protein MPW14_20470 [Candidatus Manganitrophus sp.]